jgi:hypothetical protein
MSALVLLVLLASNVAIPDGTSAPWRDDFTAPLAALALLQSLNSDLLSHDSATLTSAWSSRPIRLRSWGSLSRVVSLSLVTGDSLIDDDWRLFGIVAGGDARRARERV